MSRSVYLFLFIVSVLLAGGDLLTPLISSCQGLVIIKHTALHWISQLHLVANEQSYPVLNPLLLHVERQKINKL